MRTSREETARGAAMDGCAPALSAQWVFTLQEGPLDRRAA
jgi:hypothetical protein